MKQLSLTIVLLSLIFICAIPTKQVQLGSTSLKITVLDDLGNIQEGAVVAIYENEVDYRFETNPVAGPEETDHKGRVTFKNLPDASYYVMAVKGDKKNDGKGVLTSKLSTGRLNKINIVIQ